MNRFNNNQLHEIDLNKQECTEFLNFSIRKKEPKNCWRFGSLGDFDNKIFALYNSAESISDLVESLVIDNNMCKTVYNRSLEGNKCEYGKSVNEDTRMGSSINADNTEPEGLQMQKKRYRLLSDIYKDPASELRVGRDITNPENVNSKFIAETEDDNDDITLGNFFRKQMDVEITPSSKKRKLIQDEKSIVDLDKKSRYVSIDSNGNGSVTGNENDDITFQEFSRKQKDVEFTASSKKRRKLIQDEKSTVDLDKKSSHGSDDSNVNGSVSELQTHLRNANRINSDAQTVIKRKKVIWSPLDQYEEKGGNSSLDCNENTKRKDLRLPCYQQMNKPAESNNAQTTEQISEDSEMEVVMLLARHFNKENPSTSGQTKMVCACVQKKNRAFSTNKSVNTKTSSKTAVTYADTCNKFIKEKLEKAICSDDYQSKLALRSATASMFLAKLEKYGLNGARNVEKCSTFVCSVNRNPADFCNPNVHNKFMRGG